MLEIIIPLLHKCRLFLYFLHLFFKPIDQFFIYKLQYSRSLEELFLPLYKKQFSNFLYFKFSLFLNFSNFDALEFSTFKFFLRKFLPQNPSLLLSSRTSTHRLSNMCVCVYMYAIVGKISLWSFRFPSEQSTSTPRHFAPPPWIIDSETISRVAVRK